MVEVARRCRGGRWLARALRGRAGRMLGALGLDRAELSLVLVSDPQMRALNRTHRGIDRATDVLSFPMDGRRTGRPAGGVPALLGDVVISVDTARRQARAEGLPVVAVGERLLVHGLLHLLGYDHEVSAAAARRMVRREAWLAAALRRRRGRMRAGAR